MSKGSKWMHRICGMGMLWAAVVTTPLSAAERQVVVNGRLLGPAALASFDRRDCRRIPDGNYRHDDAKGIWGPADGSKPWRRLGENCRKGKAAAPVSRGMDGAEAAGAEPPGREEPITGTSPLMREK